MTVETIPHRVGDVLRDGRRAIIRHTQRGMNGHIQFGAVIVYGGLDGGPNSTSPAPQTPTAPCGGGTRFHLCRPVRRPEKRNSQREGTVKKRVGAGEDVTRSMDSGHSIICKPCQPHIGGYRLQLQGISK